MSLYTTLSYGEWISKYKLLVDSFYHQEDPTIAGYHASFLVNKLYSYDRQPSNSDVSEYSNSMTERQQHNILAMPYSKLSSTPHNPGRYQKNSDVFPYDSHANYLPGVLSVIYRKSAWEGFSGFA
jgi:hypothetical protein